MIDIYNKKCHYNNCIKQPVYNYKDQKKGLYYFHLGGNNI
jgi:hypothetical protein